MRILVVTQMWPSEADPDFGAFLVPQVEALRSLGHEIDVVAIDRRGSGPQKHLWLMLRASAAALRMRPDVILAHMLFPAGASGRAAAGVARAPLVVMAHGQDVENLATPRVRAATARVVRDAAAVIVNSDWLGNRLREYLPGTQTETISLGVDTERFSPEHEARADWPGDRPRLLCVGSLTARKNVLALADAFGELGEGSLVFVGDGELRAELESRPGVTVTGRIPHDQVADWIAACDLLCQPSLAEPFGIAALEAMAIGRPVLVSANGGAAEFVTPESGVVVDPTDADALKGGLRRALALGSPNDAARAAAAAHSSSVEAQRLTDLLERVARR